MTDLDWRHRARCKGEDPELFFPAGTGSVYDTQIAQAKAVCARCPVIEQCREWALESGEGGIWGGMSEEERRALRRRQRRRTA